MWSVLGNRQAGLSGVSSLVIGDKASKILVNGCEVGENMFKRTVIKTYDGLYLGNSDAVKRLTVVTLGAL